MTRKITFRFAGPSLLALALAMPMAMSPIAAPPANALFGIGGGPFIVYDPTIFVRGSIEEIDESKFDEVMDVNIKGAYFLCREVGRGMMARKRGKVVNIASLTTAIPRTSSARPSTWPPRPPISSRDRSSSSMAAS